MAWAAPWEVTLGCAAFVVWWILAVFPAVPFLPIGRTAGSVLGAVLMVVFQVVTPNDAFQAIDLPILALLFGTMVLSVYLERANLFEHLGSVLSWKSQGGKDLLYRICILSALCSALFTNDTTCVVLTKFVLQMCGREKLQKLPFLMGLATSANIGSAATAIGNPQNLVIAVQSGMSFDTFIKGVIPAVVVGIALNILLLLTFFRRQLSSPPRETENKVVPVEEDTERLLGLELKVGIAPSSTTSPSPAHVEQTRDGPSLEKSERDVLQNPRIHMSGSGLELYEMGPAAAMEVAVCITREAVSVRSTDVGLLSRARRARVKMRTASVHVYLVTLGFLAALLFGLNLPWSSLTAAVILMILDFTDAGPSLEKVSYSLLVFFSGLFIVVKGFSNTGAPGELWNAVESHARIDNAEGLIILSLVVIFLSNVVSNVPTVLLLGTLVAKSAELSNTSVNQAWLLLAWVSTVAGNLTLLGSAANIIVSEQARTAGHDISFWEQLAFGFPSTLIVVAVGLPLISA